MIEKTSANSSPYLGGITIENCLRCSNPLTHKEMKAQRVYCAPCANVIAEDAHREILGQQIENANRRMK